MHFAILYMHANTDTRTHTHVPNRLCVYRVSTGTWAQQGRWEVNKVSQGIVLVKFPQCLMSDMCVPRLRVWAGSVSSRLSWHCLQWKELYFISIMKKKEVERWGNMLMLLCEGTLTSAHTAKQLGELNYSVRSESKRMGQEKGGCVRRTHTNTKNRWRGRGSDREAVSMGPHIQICKQV